MLILAGIAFLVGLVIRFAELDWRVNLGLVFGLGIVGLIAYGQGFSGEVAFGTLGGSTLLGYFVPQILNALGRQVERFAPIAIAGGIIAYMVIFHRAAVQDLFVQCVMLVVMLACIGKSFGITLPGMKKGKKS